MILLVCCRDGDVPVVLKSGMRITGPAVVEPGVYHLPGSDSLDRPVLTIEGNNLTVDFNGAVLVGSEDPTVPDQFTGLAVLVRDSRLVTIKNLRARGYKVALMAVNVDSLQLIDCDLSYNYRPRLYSMREREAFSDWLSYHNNEEDEWLRYGAAAYLKNCDHALVRGLTATGGQNGLMLAGCDEGLFYNNTIHFNSGVGIGLYRSSGNRVMNNRLDWNVRGYSHGFYRRGQDSAGILCYEQSNGNTFAYNSATHSGDGFFLWAGQTTMDTGEGGCNDNLIYGNDFSHAPTNGVEITFSRNRVVANRLEECTYGVWGGYSFESVIRANDIRDNTYGVAIEHGQQNAIVDNYFYGNETAVRLWERESQPAGWGYAENRDVRSRDYQLGGNAFVGNRTVLQISHTDQVAVNDDNQFHDFDKLLQVDAANAGFYLVKNDIYQVSGFGDARQVRELNRLHDPLAEAERPAPAWLMGRRGQTDPPPAPPDGMDALLPATHPRGRKYILVDEWGPYDFRYPSVWLRDVTDKGYVFLLLGPQGNWKLTGGEGFGKVSLKSGSFPATVVAERLPGAALLGLDFQFIGEAFTDRFGEPVPRGEATPFSFRHLEVPVEWKVDWYAYEAGSDPLKNQEAFRQLKAQEPLRTVRVPELAYRWWGAPAEGVPEDRFATFAGADLQVPSGRYRLQLTSDDGVRLYLDGRLLIDRWDVHEPTTDVRTVALSGRHRIDIEHFDAGGLATLDLYLAPAR